MISKTACFFLTACLFFPEGADCRPTWTSHRTPDINILVDPHSQNVAVWWEGRGTVRRVSLGNRRPTRLIRPSPRRSNVVIERVAASDGVLYYLDQGRGGGEPVYSSAVGYVYLQLPPGLSLIANPLFHTEQSLGYWMPAMPDGSQVYKLLPVGGYEVSTFDALAGAWSNPGLEIPIGTGFYFFNPSGEAAQVLFVGGVLQGQLVNPLPAGVSLKSSLVPQAGSINTLHGIPGESGDELRVYVNDLQGGGAYDISVYVEGQGWVPDLTLKVAQGFYIQKQRAQFWVRDFFVN